MPDQEYPEGTRIVNVPGDPVPHIFAPTDGKPATDAQVSAALKAIPAASAPNAAKARTWTDLAVDALPATLGTAGGIVGGMGGTVLGMGIGGVPGAAGGAGLGAAAGEAAKQLINHARGADAPRTAFEAAKAIGKEGVINAATTGALGAAGSVLAPSVATGLADFGTNPNVPKVGAALGKAVGSVAPAIAGAYESGPIGAIAGLVAASKGAWAGGKTGWFTAKLMQDAARPISTLLSRATGAPIAAISEALSGITAGEAVKVLINAGVSQGEAVRTVANAQVKAKQ